VIVRVMSELVLTANFSSDKISIMSMMLLMLC